MNIYTKNIFKKLFHSLGWDIYRFTPSSSPQMQIITILKKKNVNLIFDIGANIGQFAKGLRSAGYQNQIISFEPLKSAHSKLLKIAKKDNKWHVHDQCALGDQDKDIQINISKNSVSSSLLSMLDKHISAAPNSEFISSEKVSMFKLDSISKKYLGNDTKLLLKIDAQGYEWEVMNGAEHTISKASVVICELSLVQLYKNQKLWRDIIDRLESVGFTLWALQKGLTDPKTGQSLQMDGIFLHKDR